jgi:Na+/H+ antiporter NhaA
MSGAFSTQVSQEWLIRFVEHRIGDLRITRQIRKWLKAGVLEDGVVTVSEKGHAPSSMRSFSLDENCPIWTTITK